MTNIIALPRRNSTLVERAIKDPASIYRCPNDVLRDRRLSREDRIEILWAWNTPEAHGALRELGKEF